MAKRTASGLNEIRKLINVEEKYLDNSGSPTFDQSGSVTYISGMAQGDGVTDREGNSIKVQSFSLNYYVAFNTLSVGAQCVRILIVRDLQNAGATITANDVLETVGTNTAPVTFYDYTNGQFSNKRFSIVYDSLESVDASNPIKTATFKSNHDCHVAYRGTTSAVASAGNGSYFLVAVSSSTTNLPQLFFSCRIVYTDN